MGTNNKKDFCHTRQSVIVTGSSLFWFIIFIFSCGSAAHKTEAQSKVKQFQATDVSQLIFKIRDSEIVVKETEDYPFKMRFDLEWENRSTTKKNTILLSYQEAGVEPMLGCQLRLPSGQWNEFGYVVSLENGRDGWIEIAPNGRTSATFVVHFNESQVEQLSEAKEMRIDMTTWTVSRGETNRKKYSKAKIYTQSIPVPPIPVVPRQK